MKQQHQTLKSQSQADRASLLSAQSSGINCKFISKAFTPALTKPGNAGHRVTFSLSSVEKGKGLSTSAASPAPESSSKQPPKVLFNNSRYDYNQGIGNRSRINRTELATHDCRVST